MVWARVPLGAPGACAKSEKAMASRPRKPTDKSAKQQNRKVDEEVEESFPASDPPAFVGGKHLVGAPERRKTPARKRAKPRK